MTKIKITDHICYQGFPDSSVGKESACNAEDSCSIPGLGRCPGEGIGYPLQYSGLKNSMDCIVHGVTKSWTQLSNFHFICVISQDVLEMIFSYIVGRNVKWYNEIRKQFGSFLNPVI